MKRFCSFALAIAMTLGLLSGCGSQNSGTQDNNQGSASQGGASVSTPADGLAGYPEKDLQIIVPYDPGGGSDTLVRGMMQYMNFPTNVIAVNISGASGYTGALDTFHRDADGYTIMTHNIMDLLGYTLSGTTDVDLFAEMEYICDVVADYNVLCTNTKSGWTTVEEVVEYVTANPGTVTVGCTGSQNVNYATTMEVLDQLGIADYVTIVPYDGGAASETALQGNHIQLEVNSLADIATYLQAGSTIPLMLVAENRIDALPDVPTSLECGLTVTYSKPRGYYAPPGTDPAIVEYLSGVFKEICENAEFVEYIEGLGYNVAYVDGKEATERASQWYEDLTVTFENMYAQG